MLIRRIPRSASLAVSCLLFLAACSGGTGSQSADAPLGDRVNLPGFSFQPPASWKSEPPSSGMRQAQYRVEPAAGDADPGECALFHFPGSGGPVQANIDRWIGQFQQPDGSNSADHASVEHFTSGELNITFVQVTGTYMGGMGGPGEPKPGYGMAAGVVEMPQGPWFVKCTGPAATMEAAAPGVKSLLKSARG
jgi:hypothetical protein